MRKLLILIVLAFLAALLYVSFAKDKPRRRKRRRESPTKVVRSVVRSGRKVGESAGDLYKRGADRMR